MDTPNPQPDASVKPNRQAGPELEAPPEPRLLTRKNAEDRESDRKEQRELLGRHSPEQVAASLPPVGVPCDGSPGPAPRRGFTFARLARVALITVSVLLLLIALVTFAGERWMRSAARASLPQIDGQLTLPGLSAPVTVARDPHGVPFIQAATLDDLVLAQAFTTAQDRLFQMDLLRRHAAGELAEILGPSLVPHDRLQRTLQVRASADRALAQLPADQRHQLEVYARGVNAAIAAESAHLPIEFRILHYTPAPWTARDSVLCYLAIFEDLTNGYPAKLAREAMDASLPPELVADLYPVGSWRDHPPTVPVPDLTLPGPPIEEIPLDESQASLIRPATGVRGLDPESWVSALTHDLTSNCAQCRPGSNNWVVSGAHTANGKPLLSNDMHLQLTVPGLWYEANLKAGDLHVAGVTLPGLPLVIVGHTDHIAWGFTNLGADVQDVYIEQIRGSSGGTEFLSTDGSWQPVTHVAEHIVVRGGRNQTLDVQLTRHGTTPTPILTPVLHDETRTLALRWTLYDPAALEIPTLLFAHAHDYASFQTAMAHFGGPAENVVYADDQGHIAYHAAGMIPLRGAPPKPAPTPLLDPTPDVFNTTTPDLRATPDPLAKSVLAMPAQPAPTLSGPLSPVPIVSSAATEWSGYIPFAQLPNTLDPPGGVIATANGRIVPDEYPYPIALNWADPYRTDRLYHLLANRHGLRPADMLAIQSDIYSDFDRTLAERLAYAIDHSALIRNSKPADKSQVLAAADMLRNFDGQMTADSTAAAIVSATHNILWRLLIEPRLSADPAPAGTRDPALTSLDPTNRPTRQQARLTHHELRDLYLWGEKDYALEQIIAHAPSRWLPPGYRNWDDLLASSVDLGLRDAKAPADLNKFRYGAIHVVDLEHPVFGQSPRLARMLGLPTGTGARPQSGDTTTVKQVARTFGPSERFTADLGNPDASTLNLVLGQSGNPASPWYMDQFPAWYHVTTLSFPLNPASATHTLTLTPPQ